MGAFDVFRKNYTVKRKTASEYIGGHWVKGSSESSIIILASCQPMTDRELSQLPEGRIKNQTYKLYTATKLYTVQNDNQEGVAVNPDIVIVPEYATSAGNERFEVIGVYPYQSGIINNYKCIIQLTKQGQ